MDSLSWSAPTKRSMQHATVTVFYAVKYSLTKSNLGLTCCPAMFGRQTGGWNHQPLHQYLLYPEEYHSVAVKQLLHPTFIQIFVSLKSVTK